MPVTGDEVAAEFEQGAVLAVWERAAALPPLERGLAVLAGAYPELAQAPLAELSVGRRNVALLGLREALEGGRLEARVRCPACGSELELGFDPREVFGGSAAGLAPGAAGSSSEVREIAVTLAGAAAYVVRFRLPTSRDLAAARATADVELAREMLIARCVQSAVVDGHPPLAAADLPAEIVSAVADALADADPGIDPHLGVSCGECSHTWVARLDAESLVWTEIAALAQRVLHEVHVLASTYGWHELDILAMSPARRQAYLELVTVG